MACRARQSAQYDTPIVRAGKCGRREARRPCSAGSEEKTALPTVPVDATATISRFLAAVAKKWDRTTDYTHNTASNT